MTESREGRIDLRSLDAARDPEREDAAVAAVMSRVRELQQLLRYRRRMLAAAAVLAAIATGVIATSPSRTGSSDPIAEWATSSHVPTNGELLAVFHGYRP